MTAPETPYARGMRAERRACRTTCASALAVLLAALWWPLVREGIGLAAAAFVAGVAVDALRHVR